MKETAVVKAEPTLPARTQDKISPIELIQHALESGTSADQLEKLVVLHERMSDREAAKEFIEALARFQSECPAILKTKTVNVQKRSGGHYSYDYEPLDRIVPVIAPHLLRNGFSYSWDSHSEGSIITTICTLSHINGHAKSSAFSTTTQSSNPGMSEQQKAAGALTFGRRQTLVQVLGLVTADRDTDCVPADKITAEQEANIEALISEVGADRAKFLKFFSVDKVENMLAAQYGAAVRALEQKRRQS
jgi:hypothetical protein